ncbi:MAG: porin family protein, partial [Methylococcales bacterium]|nr:porin family protein [Methylococcales bacterium]
GSKFRPWIIPAGFGLHVISPPSDGVTVTAPGIFFGAGADYNVWKSITVGFDGRYHLVSNTTADVDLDGFEVGGYVGFGF